MAKLFIENSKIIFRLFITLVKKQVNYIQSENKVIILLFINYKIMNSPQTAFEDIQDFEQVLKFAIETRNLKYYAYALGLSRNAQPTPQTVALTLRLIDLGGSKWFQVLQRQAVNNYRLVYEVAYQNKYALQVLVGLASQQSHREQLRNLCARIIYEMQSSGEVWSAFYVLLKMSLDSTDPQYKFQLLGSVNKLISSNKLPLILNNLASMQYSEQLQGLLGDNNVTFFNIYSMIIQFYIKCSHYALRKGKFLALVDAHQPLVNFTNQIFNNTLMLIQNQSILFQSQDPPTRRKNILLSHGLLCLQHLSRLTSLQFHFIKNAQALAKALMALPVLYEGNSIEDRLNYEYGVICQEFGADIQSLVCQTISTISLRVPGVFKEIILLVQASITNQTDTKSVISGFILFALLRNLVIERDDIVAQIATPLIDYVMNQVGQQTPMQISCRVLRLLLFYGPIINEKQYRFLYKSSIALLGSQPCSSFGFKQADNIFQYMIQDSKKGGRYKSLLQIDLKQTIMALLNIVSQTKTVIQEDREQKAMRIVNLVSTLIDIKQTYVVDLAPKIIKISMDWLLEEINIAWNKEKKHSPLIYELAKLLKHNVNLVSREQIFISETSQQLYKVLQLLKYPQRLQITEELIQILETKLNSEEMDGQLCQTLVTTLQSVVTYQNGNLNTVSIIMKALNGPMLSKSIIFQWGDLITYIANLYINYFSNFNRNITMYYRAQFDNISSYFQKYLQVYQPYFESNTQFRNYLLQSIRALHQGQWRCRFFLVLHHQAPTDGYDIFNFQQIKHYKKKGTMKLVFFYFINSLLRNFKENSLNNLVLFYKIYEQKRIRREFQIQPIEGVPYPELNLRSYILEGLKELRKKNNIDLIEFHEITKQLRMD